MKHSTRITLFLTFLFISIISIGQDCNVDGKKDWQKVEVRVLTQATPPNGFELTREWAVKGLGNTGSISKIEDKHLKKIKRKTADNKSCIVYIDVHGIMNYPGGLYYYSGYEKY